MTLRDLTLGGLVSTLAIALAGCGGATAAPAKSGAGGSTASSSARGEALVVDAAGEGGVSVSALSGRRLAKGECGFFLWTERAPVEFVFFSSASSAKAAMHIDGREVALARIDQRGKEIGGQFTSQTFAGGELTADLTVTPGETLANGARLEDGRLRLRHASGWSAMVPVAGLAACQP